MYAVQMGKHLILSIPIPLHSTSNLATSPKVTVYIYTFLDVEGQ
jgi:hypothetical protein